MEETVENEDEVETKTCNNNNIKDARIMERRQKFKEIV